MAIKHFLLCICLLGAAAGLRDELLWAKQQWPELTLEFPWQVFKEEAGRIQRGEETSLDGPDLDLPMRVADAEARGSKLHPDLLEVTPADTSRPHPKAVAALSCHECQALTARLWEDMVAWVNVHGKAPGRAAIAQYAQDLCQYEIPVSVLKSSMLFRVDVRRTFVTKPAKTEPGEDAEPQFYVGPRASDRAVPEREQALARQACRELLPGSGVDVKDSPGSLVASVAEHLVDYAAALARLRSSAGLPDHLPSRGEPPAPVLDQSCVDKHPLCESWAARGECAANPNYMVGKSREHGSCRRACGRCTVPPAPSPAYLASSQGLIAAAAAQEDKARRESVAQDACPTCAATGGDEDETLVGLLAESERGGARGIAAVPPSVLEQTTVMLVRPMSDPLLPLTRNDAPPPAAALRVPEPTAPHVDRALHDAVGGKCLYVSTGWWLYEVCPGWRVMQFHLNPGQGAESVSSLGIGGEAAHWHHAWAASPLLFPGTNRAPALRMELHDGTACPTTERGEDDDSSDGAGTDEDNVKVRDRSDATSARRSTLLALCSPDGRLRVAVRELERCVYTIEVYVPALCSSLPVGRRSADDDDDPLLDPGLSVVEQEELELGGIQIEQEEMEALLQDDDAIVIIDEL